jgi:PAS domain S-box-containing protein
MRRVSRHAWRPAPPGGRSMPGSDASDPAAVPETLPVTAPLKRWQDFYAFLVEDATKWAATRALIRAVPEALPDALLIFDAAGVIVLVNNQLELMFGYHRSELIGKTPELLLPPALREQHVGLRRGYANAPRPRSMAMASSLNYRVSRKNGAEFHVHVMLNPVATPDGICTIAVIRRADEAGRDGGIAGEPC